MSESIILKKSPKIEFKLHDDGFQVIDDRPDGKSGVYDYDNLQMVELNRPWYPRFAKWMRIISWIGNGVPYHPDAASYKRSNIIIHLKKAKFGIWLTDTQMAKKAREIKEVLDRRANRT